MSGIGWRIFAYGPETRVEQLAEIHTRRTQDGIDVTSEYPEQSVSIHPMFLFHVSDSRLDRSPSPHPFPKYTGCIPPPPFVDMDLHLTNRLD